MTISVKITRQENATYYDVNLNDVVEVDLTDYIAGVVASEMGNAKIQAAKAQAIAARTFAYPYYSKGKILTDASSTHQAFRTSRLTSAYANARQAAIETEGMVLTYDGVVINSCPYSNSNGGWTVSSQARWGGYRPWLIEQNDPWDAAAGGSGNGHGVGMSQVGCHYAAKIGKTYEEILAFYYPGTTIVKEGEDKTMNETVLLNEKANKVIQAAQSAMGWPYVYGAWGAMCTPAERRSRANSHADHAAAIRKNCQVLNGSKDTCDGCKWNGARCFDCRGFTYWCLKETGIVISGAGATSQYNATSNWIMQGKIADMPNVVCCLFQYKDGKMQHTGLHIGDGNIIHCSVNVQTGKTTNTAWTHYAIPIGLYIEEELTAAGKVVVKPTLKKGSNGEAVRILQQKLTELGFLNDTIDGVFGTNTEMAVKTFQAANGLTVDGICGTQTWAKINTLPEEKEIIIEKPEEVQQTENFDSQVNTGDSSNELKAKLILLQTQLNEIINSL